VIKEDNNFLSVRSKLFIEDKLLSSKFPMYYTNYAVNMADGAENFTHVVLRRKEERTMNEPLHPFYHNFIKILDEFCNKNKLSYKEVLRICINFNFPTGAKVSSIHVDHEIEHNQLLVYLNNPLDKKSSTVLLDDNNKKMKEIFPEKYKGVFFPKMPHYANFPKKGGRFVLVFTMR